MRSEKLNLYDNWIKRENYFANLPSGDVTKVIAFSLMLYSHVIYGLFREYNWARFINKIDFPMICCLLTVGILRSKSVKRYFKRLFIFALISQIPYYLVFGARLNVGFTLLGGAFLIASFQGKFISKESKYYYVYCFLAVLSIVVIGNLVRFDNGLRGMLLPLAIFLAPNLFVGTLFIMIFFWFGHHNPQSSLYFHWYAYLANFAIFFLNWYLEKIKGLSDNRFVYRYFFYVAYPVHFLIIAAIAYFTKT